MSYFSWFVQTRISRKSTHCIIISWISFSLSFILFLDTIYTEVGSFCPVEWASFNLHLSIPCVSRTKPEGWMGLDSTGWGRSVGRIPSQVPCVSCCAPSGSKSCLLVPLLSKAEGGDVFRWPLTLLCRLPHQPSNWQLHTQMSFCLNQLFHRGYEILVFELYYFLFTY